MFAQPKDRSFEKKVVLTVYQKRIDYERLSK